MPDAFVSVVRVEAGASFLTVTLAPTMTAPVVSLTVPRIVDATLCASAGAAATRSESSQ